ncbi:MAG: aldehyde dehydrogenase family protein [Melioribacteraceae bacterium]|nr:aldehyde dehydrogenase family protein [Melioribacteraceae bacterium]MCF8265916.1 aldehyde dehydrogenase family protein [Melioribacteraceae bacterium]MCF8412560.1 aldehyde dehydrogenase family protein [Melioribacteraceae bacterium]MCF8431675.1 aldehyde dehydrogenase family protein [Melioribacteraceae bacterium]
MNPGATENIESIFEYLVQNQRIINQRPISYRKQKLKKLHDEILRRSNDIQEAIYKDFRKAPDEVKLTEIFPATSEIKLFIRKLNKWSKPKRAPMPITFFGSKSRIFIEPKGTVLIISPWNFPFLLAMDPLIAAVAAGNNFICKPSEHTPNASKIIKEIVGAVFEKSEGVVIEGDGAVSQKLTQLPFDHIFFTGGTGIGKKVMSAASQNLTSVTLELGGKSPVIIMDNADLRLASERVAWGKFMNAGQTCIAPDYVLVSDDLKQQFITHLKESISKYYGKSELEKNGDFCRIVNQSHVRRVASYLEEARSNNAVVEFGGDVDESKNFIGPTIISNVQLSSLLMKNEIFGPVLPIITYKDEVDIQKIISKNPNPLALYVFSKSVKDAKKIILKIPSGGAAINDVVVHYVNPNIPFGGRNSSGIGSARGYYGFKAFSHERSVMIQPSLSAMKFLFPPYKKVVSKLIDLLIKFF